MFLKRFTILCVLFLGLYNSSLYAQTVIDTNQVAFTTLYLESDGEVEIVLDTNNYNTNTDSVYFVRSVFDCVDINDSVQVGLVITDTSLIPAQTYFTRTLIFWVRDTIAPFLVLTDTATVYMKANGTAKMTYADIDNGSWDSCGISLGGFQILTQTDFFCSNIGTQKILIRVPDVNNNIASDSIFVEVVDTIKPTLSMAFDTLYLMGNPLSGQLFFNDIDNGSSDNCGLDSATLNGSSSLNFSCVNVGLNTIQVALFDLSGNQSNDSLSFFVIDTLGFGYTTSPYTAYLNGDSVSVYRDSIIAVNNGGCFPPSLVFLSDTSFNCNAINNNPNYIKFSLSSGPQTVIDSVAITVLDSISPQLSLKSDTLYMLPGGLNVGFAAIDDGSTDNCLLDTAQLNGGSSAFFTCADTGAQQIMVVLFDGSGNSSSDSVEVFIRDTITPNYAVNPFTAYLQSDSVLISRGDVLSSLTGGCTNTPVFTWQSDTALACSNTTSNPNYLQFTITGGGFAVSDSVAVTVLDTVSPTIILNLDTVYLSGAPLQASVDFNDVASGSFDNCGLDTIAINGQTQVDFTCANLGSNLLTVWAADASGNHSMDTISVIVLDTISPSYTLTPVTAYLLTDSTAVPVDSMINGLSAGCGMPTVSVLSDTVFDCADVAANPNYVVFEIAYSGNTILDSTAVTVLDTVKPTLALKSDTLVLGASGYTLLFGDIDNGSLDNCALDSALLNGSNQVYFNCADTGLATISVDLYDINGNSESGSVNVYVIDTLQPGYTKTPFTAYLVSNSFAVSRTDILTNVTGGCGTSLTLSILSDTVFDCSDVQLNPQYISFSIVTSSFSIVDSVPVTVLDTAAPIAMLKSDTLYLNAGTLTADLLFADIDNGSTDNCTIDSISLNGQTQLVFNCNNLGENNVVVRLADESGNSAFDTASVWVLDTIGPNYTAAPVTVYLQSSPVTLSIDSLVQNPQAGCSMPVFTAISDSVFDCASIDNNPNYLVFNASAGGKTEIDSLQVTVLDTLKPTVLIPVTDTIVIFGTSATLKWSDIDLGSFDNCSIDSVILNGQDSLVFTCSDLGNNFVNVNVFDPSGNVDGGTILLFVDDTISPSYTKTPYDAYLAGDSAVVSRSDILTNISAGCSGNASAISILSDTVFDCSDIALNPRFVLFTVTAGSLTELDSVPVTVIDTISPTFSTKPPQTVFLDSSGQSVLQPLDLLNGLPQDNCGIDSIAITPSTLTCANLGQFAPVGIQVWDVNGNSATRFMFVLASDSTRPVAVAKQALVQLDSVTGTFTLNQAHILDTVYDNCMIASTVITPNTFSCADTGWQQVSIVVSDGSNNQTNLSTQVYVYDSIAPAFVSQPNIIAYLDNNGISQIGLQDFLIGQAFDACGIVDTVISNEFFSCGDVGPNFVAFQLIDGNGNVSGSNVVVNVQDTIKPTVVPQNITLNLNTSGQASITVVDVTDTLFDNCAINAGLTMVSPNTFNCNTVGPQTVTIQITDLAGNTTVKTAIVTIQGGNSSQPQFSGPDMVCGNAYNIKYVVDNVDSLATYKWSVQGGKVIGLSHKGREAFIHFTGTGSADVVLKTELSSGCFSDSTIKQVNISGLAPDTAQIVFWNPTTRTTLLIQDQQAAYYQWGFDVWQNGTLISTTIAGETGKAYYNNDIPTNIDNADYRYWCETSFDNVCWTRSYLGAFPIGQEELNNKAELEIWPNPFNSLLHVSSNQELKQIQLFDLTGALLRSIEPATTEVVLENLDNLPPSTYLLVVTYSNGSTSHHKIVRVL